MGTLGVGGEVAVRVLQRANVRFGFSGLGLGYNFNHDGIDYGARVRMEGAQATFDYFLIGGFRISPGALLYNGTKITGTASVPSGSTFTLNSVTYESSTATPVAGSVGVTFRKVAPVLLFGLGNLQKLARQAAEQLAAEGFDCAIINPRFTKPIDEGTTAFFGRSADVVVTIEDHVLNGGYGSAVLELFSDRHLSTPVVRIGWPDQFIEHASTVDHLREKYGLTAANIVARVKAEFSSIPAHRQAIVTAVA